MVDLSKALYINRYIQKEATSLQGNNGPHKWTDNAELSVPDQMTSITEKRQGRSLTCNWADGGQAHKLSSTLWVL